MPKSGSIVMKTPYRAGMGKTDALLYQARAHLEQDESIDAAVHGIVKTRALWTRDGAAHLSTNAICLATDRRILFFWKYLGGSDFDSYPYGIISSLEHSNNQQFFSRHEFSFLASGSRVQMTGIKSIDELVAFVTVVRSRIERKPTAATSEEPSSPGAPSLLEQIKQLGDLRDSGILTEEEFNTKKAELLNRL